MVDTTSDFGAGIAFIVRNKAVLLGVCAGPSETYVVEQTIAALAAAPKVSETACSDSCQVCAELEGIEDARLRAEQADPAPSVAGELDRFTMDTVWRFDSAGAWMFYADHARIVAEKDAALASLRASKDEQYMMLRGSHDTWQFRAEAAEARSEALAVVLQKIATINAMDYEYQRWARNALLSETGK